MSFELVSGVINSLIPGTFLAEVSLLRSLYTHASLHATLDADDNLLDSFSNAAAVGAKALNAEVLLRWHSRDETQTVDCFRGYVRAIRVERIEQRSYFHFECVSFSAQLDQVRNFRVWQDTTLQKICQYLIAQNSGRLAFGDGGAAATAAISLPLSVQYDETDFAYLARMLHAWGIPLANDDLARKVFIGKPAATAADAFPQADWQWNLTTLEAELVPLQTIAKETGAKATGAGAPGMARTQVQAFNAALSRTPAHLYDPRLDALHQSHYQQTRQMEDKTNFDTNAVVCRARWTQGVFDQAPGCLVGFAGQRWLVREVSLQGHGERGGGSEWVAQEFTLQDKLVPLIPRYRRTPWPTACLWAHVVKNDAADPTKSGQVQVQFDWEVLETTSPQRCWLPTLTSYGGLKGKSGTSGFLSLPEVGEHVLVQFLDGWDSDAVVLGSVREYAAAMAYHPEETKWWRTPSGNAISLTTKSAGHTDIVEVRCQEKLLFRGEIAASKQTVVMDLMGSTGDRIHFEKSGGPAQLDIFCSGKTYVHAERKLMLEGKTIQIKATGGAVKIDGTPMVQINNGPTGMQPLHLDTAIEPASAGIAAVAAPPLSKPASEAGGGRGARPPRPLKGMEGLEKAHHNQPGQSAYRAESGSDKSTNEEGGRQRRSGKEINSAGKEFEELVRKITGGKQAYFDIEEPNTLGVMVKKTIEMDSVTDEALIQAKSSRGAKSAHNVLSPSYRAQIKRTVKLAKELGKRAEYWLDHEPLPQVREYLEKKGVKVTVVDEKMRQAVGGK